MSKLPQVEQALLDAAIRGNRGFSGVGICGVCGEWSSRGGYFVSGPRNRNTGETPHDNFICALCQKEAKDARTLEKACERWDKRAAAGRFWKQGALFRDRVGLPARKKAAPA